MCGNIFQIHGVHIPKKCIDSRHFYSRHSPLKSRSRPRQKEITHSPRQYSFENLFPSTAERGGGNYDLIHHQLQYALGSFGLTTQAQTSMRTAADDELN